MPTLPNTFLTAGDTTRSEGTRELRLPSTLPTWASQAQVPFTSRTAPNSAMKVNISAQDWLVQPLRPGAGHLPEALHLSLPVENEEVKLWIQGPF